MSKSWRFYPSKSMQSQSEDNTFRALVPRKNKFSKRSRGNKKKVKLMDENEGQTFLEKPILNHTEQQMDNMQTNFLLDSGAVATNQEIIEPDSNDNQVLSIDDITAYQLEISKHTAMMPCTDEHNWFVLMDFNVKQRILKENPVFIKIVAKMFTDGCKLLLQCSCKEDQLICGISSKPNCSASDFSNHLNYCIHASAAESLILRFLKSEEIEPSAFLSLSQTNIDCEKEINEVVSEEIFPRVFEVPFCSGLCIEINKGSFAVVRLFENKLLCLTCKFANHSCHHVESVKLLVKDDNEVCLKYMENVPYDQGNSSNRDAYRKKALSFRPIPLQPTVEQIEIFQKGAGYYDSFEKDGVVTFPHVTTCYCGFVFRDSFEFFYGAKQVQLYLLTAIKNCYVPSFTCSNCLFNHIFDGCDYGVLNMGTYLVSHVVLRHYLDEFECGKLALYSSHVIYCRLLKLHGFEEKISYQKYRYAWDAFLDLMDIDFAAGFKCDKCLDQPKIILCDGTSVCFQKKMLRWEEFLKTGNQEMPKPQESRFTDRLLIKCSITRKLMLKFSLSTNGNKMAIDEYASLLTSLDTFDEGKIVKQFFISNVNPDNIFCPTIYSRLVETLSLTSPICASVPFFDPVINILNESVCGTPIKKNLNHMVCLMKNCPLLYQILTNLPDDNFPEVMHDLLQLIIKYSGAPFQNFKESPQTLAQPPTQEYEDSLSFFPSLPKLQERGCFEADKHTRRSEGCVKKFNKHPKLLPGVFTLYCGHGVCYGYQIMALCESVDVPFTILRTRFQKAPEVVVYDHACKLHSFTLNRSPNEFKNTRFLIDRLHWKNHVGCAVGYKLSEYSEFMALNSQVNEQVNASLQKIKHFLSYMTHCALYLWCYNRTLQQRNSLQ